MKNSAVLLILACFFASISHTYAAGVLSENIRIESDVLSYSLQYRVYTPDAMTSDGDYPTIYVTDGPMYIEQGEMVSVMDGLIATGKMKPVIAVFVDARNPDNLRENRRNNQYLCKADFARFFISEMITTIENNYPVSQNKQDRVIQGVSFGGLNAACFGLMAKGEFGGLSMHSPANSNHLRMLQKEYGSGDKLPLKMFLSFGNESDNQREGRGFKNVLFDRDYDVNYFENEEGHNWKNWRPLIDDALLTFFAK